MASSRLTLASGQTSQSDMGIAVDATSVYWTTYGSGSSVTKVPIGGGPQAVVAVGFPKPYGGLVVDATDAYWPGAGDRDQRRVAVRIGGCGSSAALGRLTRAGSLRHRRGREHVYWAENLTPVLRRAHVPEDRLHRRPDEARRGSEPRPASPPDGVNVYWVNASGANAVMRCAVGGCGMSPTVLATVPGAAVAVALDGTSAYWADWSKGTIQKVAK